VTANILGIILAGFLLHTKTHISSYAKSTRQQGGSEVTPEQRGLSMEIVSRYPYRT
jgi:hypothetical protein